MCGIAGFISTSHEQNKESIQNMLAYLDHRGPDEAGYVVDGAVALGTVRLSILDTHNGQQPLSAHNHRYWIAYNGELYNYLELRQELQNHGFHFETKSDTEVVLKAWIHWGSDALNKFNGAFAFAIYDRQDGSLILARDRFGKRPLFYTRCGNGFLFASEMKAFNAWPSFRFEFDPEQLSSIYGHWTPLPEQTPFKNIHQLPMGAWMKVDASGCDMHHYYALNFDQYAEPLSRSESVEQVRLALHDSIKLRLRSDVEVGVYLSGGIDSAITATIAQQLSSKQVRTFGVAFDDPELDESKYQYLMAEHLGTDHVSLKVNNQDIVEHFPQAVYHAEMPVFRSAFVPMYLLSKKVKSCGIKTILSGEGADEVFLGYSLFRETQMRSQWQDLSLEQRKQQIALLNPDFKHYDEKNTSSLLGLYQQYAQEQIPGLFSHELRLQNGRFAKRLLKDVKLNPFKNVTEMINNKDYTSLSAVEKAQYLEFKTLLPGYLLSTQGERMGLAHGVENRCPFLDPHVVGLAHRVNASFGMDFSSKEVLKRAFKEQLPQAIINRHKHSYRAPDSAAFVSNKPDYFDALLAKDELKKIECLNPIFASALVNKILTTPTDKISTRENQTFIYLLSSVLLYRQFVLAEGRQKNMGDKIKNKLTVQVVL